MDDATCDEIRAPRHVVLTVVLPLAVLVALTIWTRNQAEPHMALLALDIAAGVLGCALLPWLLRQPLPGALVLTALAVVSPAASPLATMAVLHISRFRRFGLAAGVAAAGIAAHAIQGWWRPLPGLPYGWWLVLETLVYVALVGWGTMAHTRQALIISLRERAIRAEAEQGRRVAEARSAERAEIAREMHDVLAHRLSLVATYAGALEYRPDSSPQKLAQAAGVIRAGVHQALEELRQVISVLREEDIGEMAAPQPVWDDLPRLLAESRAAGSDVRWDDSVSESAALPPVAGRTAYRVVQEGLTNARKHAAGQPVEVELAGRPGERLVIEIRNGLAAGPSSVPGASRGLIGLTERVALAGGELDHSVSTDEFRLRAWLPWPK